MTVGVAVAVAVTVGVAVAVAVRVGVAVAVAVRVGVAVAVAVAVADAVGVAVAVAVGVAVVVGTVKMHCAFCSATWLADMPPAAPVCVQVCAATLVALPRSMYQPWSEMLLVEPTLMTNVELVGMYVTPARFVVMVFTPWRAPQDATS